MCKCFLSVCALWIDSLNGIFHRAEIFKFLKKSNFSFTDCAFDILCKNSLPDLWSPRFPLTFSSRSFIVRCWIHFDLIFVKGVRAVSRLLLLFPLVYGHTTIPVPLVEKIIPSSLNYFYFFLKDQSTRFVWVKFWAFCCVLLIFVSVLLPISITLF